MGRTDPLAFLMNGESPYGYAYNNPVRFVDLFGLAPEDEVTGGKKLGADDLMDEQKGKGFHPTEIGGRQAIYNGVTYNFDDSGNINYGVAARALGLTYLEAVAGAGYNQTIQTQTPDWSNPGGFFDHSRDTQMINLGFNMLVPKK